MLAFGLPPPPILVGLPPPPPPGSSPHAPHLTGCHDPPYRERPGGGWRRPVSGHFPAPSPVWAPRTTVPAPGFRGRCFRGLPGGPPATLATAPLGTPTAR